MGSPMNVAVSVFGDLFLYACAAHPQVATHVLQVIAQTELILYRDYCHRVEPETYALDPIVFGYGNCPAVMLSPGMYADVVLPVDLWIRGQVGQFHLHHCGVLDAYREVYARLDPDSLDVGGGTDYRLMRDVFPNTPSSFIVNTELIEGRNQDEVDGVVRDIVNNGGPEELITALWLADFSTRMTDDNVRALRTSHLRV